MDGVSFPTPLIVPSSLFFLSPESVQLPVVSIMTAVVVVVGGSGGARDGQRRKA